MIKPKVSVLPVEAVGVINTIHDTATPEYRDVVPSVSETTDSIRAFGTVILGHANHRNEFVNALWNRIGLMVLTSKMYYNKLEWAKVGKLELGESIEEIFIEMAKPYKYDPNGNLSLLFGRERPNVKTMFHQLNFLKLYKGTTSVSQLRQAFLSVQGITDMLNGIINSIYSAIAFDEELMIKYLIGLLILNGSIKAVNIPDFSAGANADEIVSTIKETSTLFETASRDYNIAGVRNWSLADNQRMIVSAKFGAKVDVYSLAKAFNLEYAKMLPRQATVNGFGMLDWDRLAQLLEEDDSFTPFTEAQISVLNKVGCVLLDEKFFQIYDYDMITGDQPDPTGDYINHFVTIKRVFSASPFAPVVVFNTDTNAITSITIDPDTVTLAAGANVQFTTTVAGMGIFNTGVTYAMTGNVSTGSYVQSNGYCHIAVDETATTIKITVTSAMDETKTDTATITVS